MERYRYDAFGKPTIMDGNWTVRTQSAIGNRFMFTGREWAPSNLGFYEYRARAYHPGLGRFMSEDPKLFDAGDYNLFRYCHNDPEDLTDPMGMDPENYGYRPDRAWDMARWADRSNNLQITFAQFMTLRGSQSDAEAKGGTMGHVSKANADPPRAIENQMGGARDGFGKNEVGT